VVAVAVVAAVVARTTETVVASTSGRTAGSASPPGVNGIKLLFLRR